MRSVTECVREGFDPVAVVEECLGRIEALDARLHAFVDVYAEDARRAARAAAEAIGAGHRVGPLHGMPVAVKDIIEIEGRVTTGGCWHWRDRRSPETAALVRRMMEAGMIVLGKTHTVEFAMGGWGTNQRMGTPWNPWDPERARTPGGSSCGSGVAVAAGMAPWAIGTDTGGSVRLPSAWCGLAGLKVTVGRISTEGVMPLSRTLDTPGPMARTVADAALLYEVLCGGDPRVGAELGRGVEGLRLAVMPDAERAGADPEVLAAFDAAVDTLEGLGARVERLPSLPRSFADFAELAGTIIHTEGYSEVGALCEDPDLPLDEDVRPRILSGRETSAARYLGALREREALRGAFDEALAGFDALLTPATLTPPLPLEEVDQKGTPAVYTRMVNVLERCALVLPDGFTATGLPLSLQIVCQGGEEAMALRIGHAYERATAWHERRPPLPA